MNKKSISMAQLPDRRAAEVKEVAIGPAVCLFMYPDGKKT